MRDLAKNLLAPASILVTPFLIVNGHFFSDDAVVHVSASTESLGSAVDTEFVSSTQIRAVVPVNPTGTVRYVTVVQNVRRSLPVKYVYPGS